MDQTGVSNPFTADPVARRYRQGRPYYHASALDLAYLQADLGRAGLAVDVGCGTGLSSRAVRARAERVVALDASPAMLRSAEPIDGVQYVAADAERIPLADSSADLATIAAAFHWFDQARALTELARCLRPGAGLVVYTDAFHGQLLGHPSFTSWLNEQYLPSLPPATRHAYFDPELAQNCGFEAAGFVEDEVQIALTRSQLADYLLSQSYAALAIESGQMDAETLRARVVTGISAFVPHDDPVDAVFGVRVWTTTRRG